MLSRLRLTGLLLFLASCAAPPGDDARLNVILVCLDTLRADHLGAWGYPAGTSPALDRLARRSTSFSHAIAQSASTLPSHRSLFQSRLASNTSKAGPTLAELLREAGWATVAFTGGGNVAAELGFDRGFDLYGEDEGGFTVSLPRFERWLDGRAGDEPFFAFLHTYDVHLPYDPPAPLHELYDPDYEGTLTGERTRDFCRRVRRVGEYEDLEGTARVARRDVRHLVALYDGEIRHLDRLVAGLLADLEERDLLERTVIAIVSDHGEEFFDHGSLIHSHTVYQELVHVPLIVHAPGVASRLDPGTVRNLDVAPTLLELVGLPPHAGHVGKSLGPRLDGAPPVHLPAISEMREWKSLVAHPYKYVWNGTFGVLYDLARDPGEQQGLGPEHAGRAEALETLLFDEVAPGTVAELSPDDRSPGLEERLRALGYLD